MYTSLTKAFLAAPVCKNCPAVTVAKRKPEHAAVRSIAKAFLAPTALACCVFINHALVR